MKQNLTNRKNLLNILFFWFALTTTGFAAGGNLDPTFKAGLTNNGNSGNIANVVAVQPDGKILVGGGFFVVDGRSSQKIVRLNPDSTIDQSFNVGAGFTAGGFVNAIAVLPSGQILVGGRFLDYNGAERNGLVRLNSNGSLDTGFNTGNAGLIGFEVNAITLQPNGQILIGGTFNEYNGVSTINLARLNANGTLDTAFAAALGTGFENGNNPVYSIVVEPDGQIVVGGIFASVNGTPAKNIVRLNANGSLDTAFITNTGAGFNFTVNEVALQTDGRIVVGGSFSTFNGAERSNLVRLNANGTLDTNFNPLVTGGIKSVVIQPDGRILAGGITARFGVNLERIYIGRVNAADGSLDLSFNAGTGGNGGATGNIALQPDGSIFTTGNFFSFDNFNTAMLAKLNADGSVNTSFSVVMGDIGIVRTMFVQSDNRILIGGAYVGVNGDFCLGIARLNADGTTDTTFTSPFNTQGSVEAIAVQSDGKILIGGLNLGDLGNGSVFRLNANGSLDTTFSAPGNGIINDIAIQPDGKILIGGQGFIINGMTVGGIARLNSDGTTDATFNTGAGFTGGSGPEKILLQPNGQILVSGGFTGYNGATGVNRIARLNPNGSLDTAFTTNTGTGFDFGFAYALALQTDGKIVAGGFFSNFNGVSSNQIVRLNANGARDAGFNVGTGFDNVVLDLKVQPNGGILAGGDFRTYNGADRKHLARLGANGSLDTSFEAGLPPNNRVSAIGLQSSGKIIIGGYLTAPYPRNGIARLSSGRTAASDFDDDGRADISLFRPSNGFWYTLRSSDNGFRATQFGTTGDRIAPADYDGDGIIDIAVFRPSTGTWFLLQSGAGFTAAQFGISTDTPVPADYDGDGKTDIAVYRGGTWYLLRSTDGFATVSFGAATDQPIPAAHLP